MKAVWHVRSSIRWMHIRTWYLLETVFRKGVPPKAARPQNAHTNICVTNKPSRLCKMHAFLQRDPT